MADNDPLIRAAAEYLTMVDFPKGDHSDLYADERGPDGTVYLVDGYLDLTQFVTVIAQAERRAIVDELVRFGDNAPEGQASGYYAASHRVRDRIDRAQA